MAMGLLYRYDDEPAKALQGALDRYEQSVAADPGKAWRQLERRSRAALKGSGVHADPFLKVLGQILDTNDIARARKLACAVRGKKLRMLPFFMTLLVAFPFRLTFNLLRLGFPGKVKR
jgi:hypothetical protein